MKDKLGIFCSSLCIVHCIVTPFILALGLSGLLVKILTTEFVHYILIVPVALLILLTLPSAYTRHRSLGLIFTGLLGMMFLIAAPFLGAGKETLLTISGGSLLVVFHLSNLRLQHKYKANGAIVARLVISPIAENRVDIRQLNEKREIIYARK